ncbi:hypothetical protein Q7P37_006509 [Cladosporium fusiforme]
MPQPAVRQRASKACIRCNKRKLKCDAVQKNGPCSRCRMDRVEGCVLGTSRRGTYIRTRKHRSKDAPLDRGSSCEQETQGDSSASLVTARDSHTGTDNSPRTDITDGDPPQESISSMFESFVEGNDNNKDRAAAQLGMMLLGEHSPLTFVLKEPHHHQPSEFHNIGIDMSKRSRTTADSSRKNHPPHLSSQDIDYLTSKRAFEVPKSGLEKLLVSAFLDRFYPLYSIVDKDEILQLHRTQNLPFILLHAICLIGATFCDISVIHRYGFDSRLQARRSFYEKAKIMFDLEYERDRIVLLQTVIMLSFWGPHLESSWNPCSWIGFGVTVAASLGLHRSSSGSYASDKDRGLIKRLWWTLVVRDSYCAALMGRPARVDLSQSDTEALSAYDFPETVQSPGNPPNHALYQVQVAQLSMIIRQIIAKCHMPEIHTNRSNHLYKMLNQWLAQVPAAIAFDPGTTSHGNLFATSLKLLYHYHVLFIHLKWPNQELQGPEYGTNMAISAATLADASAQVLASTASILVTKHVIAQLPHEVFTGFFMAGIIFYRQLRQSNSLTSHAARASLDNCRLLLNEVREIFDPTHWVMRIFGFLLSSKTVEDGSDNNSNMRPSAQESGYEHDDQMVTETPNLIYGTGVNSYNVGTPMPDGLCDLFSMDWQQFPDEDVLNSYNDMWFMPDMLTGI